MNDSTIVDTATVRDSADVRAVWMLTRHVAGDSLREPTLFRCAAREIRGWYPASVIGENRDHVIPARWGPWEAIPPENWGEKAHGVVCALPVPSVAAR